MAMGRRRRVRTLAGMGLGAAAMYFLDPAQGRSRRARVRDQVPARARRMRRAAERRRRYREGVLEGIHHPMPSHAPADDRALVQRVRSTLGHAFPHDRVSLAVVDGTVELRGELDDAAAIGDLLVRVGQVPGVARVANLLHLPGQPAPTKEPALAASRRASAAAEAQPHPAPWPAPTAQLGNTGADLALDEQRLGVHEFTVDEPGFRGVLRVGRRFDGARVVLSGTRPDADDTAVEKDLPADRDPRLAALVERALAGDGRAPVEILAHVGVLNVER